MVVNLGAYAAEIVRAGIDNTPRGQIEAARSLALNELQVFTRVVLPPALGRVWPALVSQIVIVMLGSAVCGQISAQELSYAANLIQSRNFRAFEAYIVATAIYLLLSVAFRQALNWMGRRSSSSAACPTPAVEGDTMVDFSLWDIFRNLLLAARWTVGLSLIAFIGGGIVGHGAAAGAAGPTARCAARRGRPMCRLFQGTPLLMQLFLAYFGLALVGLNVSAWVAAPAWR